MNLIDPRPQITVSTAQVLLQRFYFVGSFKNFGIVEIVLGCLLLATKIEESPRRTLDILNSVCSAVYFHLCDCIPPIFLDRKRFSSLENLMYDAEAHVLSYCGFQVKVFHPYMLAIHYLRALGLNNQTLMQSMWNYLNDSYKTVVHCVFQQNTIACAAINLACNSQNIKLPSSPRWFELFDVDFDEMKLALTQIKKVYETKLPFTLPLSRLTQEPDWYPLPDSKLLQKLEKTNVKKYEHFEKNLILPSFYTFE